MTPSFRPPAEQRIGFTAVTRRRDSIPMATHYFGAISNTTRSMRGAESRSVRMRVRIASSVTRLAMQGKRSLPIFISTDGFLIIFWHQCLASTLLDDA